LNLQRQDKSVLYFVGTSRLVIITSIDENGLICQALEGELIFAHAVKHQKPLELEYEGLPSKICHLQNGENGMTVHIFVLESRVQPLKENVLQ